MIRCNLHHLLSGGPAGSIPEIVITDAATNLPIRVDSKNQGQWLEVIQEQIQFVEQEQLNKLLR
ncbi:MAG: hypothetical protein D3904_09775 [Candidatus Electrothrix sp. EH2]|nr:hypothetical protein [Candidatus Electrothrix sp. EH2]